MTKKEINIIVGKRIKARREELGISREDLANRIGVSGFGAISNYENGISVPKTEVLVKLLEALDIDANYLFVGCTPGSKTQNSKPITDEEKEAIYKFRILDDYGKKIVKFILETEYDRCQSQNK